jgi:hypothetical protein
MSAFMVADETINRVGNENDDKARISLQFCNEFNESTQTNT